MLYLSNCEKRTMNNKINGTPKGVYLLISKLNSILAVANLLAHNNISYITISCYVQVNSLRLKSNLASKWKKVHTFGGTIYFAVDDTIKQFKQIKNELVVYFKILRIIC